MAKYILAIDESGTFPINRRPGEKISDSSMVCGVLFKDKPEKTVREAFKMLYQQRTSHEPISDDYKDILGVKDKEIFHAKDLSKDMKDKCRDALLPLISKLYVSVGSPSIYANNQNWWIVAVSVVIEQFLLTTSFTQGDSVEIILDQRAPGVWGLNKDESNTDFMVYHNFIKTEIKNSFQSLEKEKKVSINIEFSSDLDSFYVASADIFCALVRFDKLDKDYPVEKCYCRRYSSNINPYNIKTSNPIGSISLVFQELDNNVYSNIGLIGEVFKKNRKDKNIVSFATSFFYDFLKNVISERANKSRLVKLKSLVSFFVSEIKEHKEIFIGLKGASFTYGDLVILFIEFYSHIGEINIDEINGLIDLDPETRILRRWENKIRYYLRTSQIELNAYNFLETKDNMSKLYDTQMGVINQLNGVLSTTKDNHISAILGTLAQAHAFLGEYDDAIDFFNLSMDYAFDRKEQTYSYLLTIYQRIKDIEKCRLYFEKQIGCPPEEFEIKNDTNTWSILSYVRLRALELYINKSTNLKNIELELLKDYNGEYPFPLVKKWEAIALYLENPIANNMKTAKYFEEAIESLLNNENGFTIKTLALSIIKCYSLINKQNKFNAQYNIIVKNLSGESKFFNDFINQNPSLMSIKNESGDIWDCANLTPFYYS